MALTRLDRTGDGTTTVYTVSFPLGFAQSDVYVSLDTDDYTDQLDYTWINSTQIQMSTPVGVGIKFNIRRVVEKNLPINDYEQGAILRENNLDNSFAQPLQILQEYGEGFKPDGYSEKQDLDLGTHRITNLAPSLNPNDAINKGELVAQATSDTNRYVAQEAAHTSRFNSQVSFDTNRFNVEKSFRENRDLQQDGRLLAVEGSVAGNSRYIQFPYRNGSAMGGEITILIPYTFTSIAGVYINGIRQTFGLSFEFNVSNRTLTFAESLYENDEVLVLIGTEPVDVPEYDVTNDVAVALDSTAARSLAARFADVVNVKDFGAIGDGLTDDTVAIQAAVDSLTTGGTIVIPNGTYLVSGQAIILVSNIRLTGGGTLKCRNVDANTKVLLGANIENVFVDGLYFDGNFSGNNTTSFTEKTFTSFIRFQECSNISFTNCFFHDLMGTSLQFSDTEFITVTGNHFTRMRTVYTGNFFLSIGGSSRAYTVVGNKFVQPESFIPVAGHGNGAIVLAGASDNSKDVKDGIISGNYFERTGRYGSSAYDGHDAPRGDIDIYNNVIGLVCSGNVSQSCQYMFFKANDCSHISIDSNVVHKALGRFVSVSNRYGLSRVEFISISNNVVNGSQGIKFDGDGTGTVVIDQVNIIGNLLDQGAGSDQWAIRLERMGAYINISNNNLIQGEIEVTGMPHSALEFPNTYKKYSIVNNRIDVRNQAGAYGIEMYGVFDHPVTGEYVGGTIKDNTILNSNLAAIFLGDKTGSVVKDNYYFDCQPVEFNNNTLIISGGWELRSTRLPKQADGTRIIFDVADSVTESLFELDLARGADGNAVICVEYSFDNEATWVTSGYSSRIKVEGSDILDDSDNTTESGDNILIAPHNVTGSGESSYVGDIRVSPRGHLRADGVMRGTDNAGMLSINVRGVPLLQPGLSVTNIAVSCYSRFGGDYYFKSGSIKHYTK